jgi:Aerotolerance regulator N-terminal
MSFAYPQFLWALLTLSIPIIIHLFNFRRTVKVLFSNTRLLKQIKQETTQKRKLKQYLVLASRLFFLFFLVIAFAQPFLPAHEQFTAGREVIIYLDNSLSMSAPVGAKARALDTGIEYAREIVNLFPADTRFKLITNDFAPFSNVFKTRAEVIDLLTQVRLSPIGRSINDITRKISGTDLADVFWISDFQKSTLGTFQVQSLDSIRSWHLAPIAFGQVSNVFVDSVNLENPFIVGGEKNVVHVRIRQTGRKKTEGLTVKLTVNGIQTATATVDLNENSFSDIRFDLNSGLTNRNEARISFNDFPVSFDNDFYFTMNFSEKITVTEIKPARGVTVIEKVFGNNALFRFRSLQTGNVNYSLLDQSDLVVINGVDAIDPSLSSALSRYVAGHGAILLIPGNSPDPQAYKNILSMNSTKAGEASSFSELDKPDFQNPFFENVFEEKSPIMAMPRAKALLDLGRDRSAILRFRDGKAFLAQNGKSFMLASPLEKEFCDFYNHALFVPVMYRIAFAGRRNQNQTYHILSERSIVVHADSLTGEEPLRLQGSQEIVPSQRRAGEKVFLEIPPFAISPGFYNVLDGKDTVDLVAFNPDKAESFLDQYTGTELREMLGVRKNISLFQASSVSAFSNEIKERYLGTPLWKQALILALFFLLAEVLLIRFLK